MIMPESISTVHALLVGQRAKISRIPKASGYKLVVDSQPPGEDNRLARDALHKQIESLQEKLESQTREYKETIEKKVEERRRTAEEYNYIRERDMDKVKTSTEKYELIMLLTL